MKPTLSNNKETDGGFTAGGTLASTVYDRLRKDILTGALAPGEKLRAEYLRNRYEVGNSPVREALNRLSVDGLVVREDQRGFRVAEVSKQDLIELIKTQCWLEEIALRESVASRDMEWEERIVLAFHRLSRQARSASRDDYIMNPEWERLHREFHLALISACGSSLLRTFCAQLNDKADRYRQLAVAATYPQRNEREEHREIMDACLEGNADRAVALLHTHYKRTGEAILSAATDIPD